MPAIVALSLNDGQATPVTHVFDVVNGQQATEPARYYDKSAGSYAGYNKLSVLVRRSATSKATKIEMRLELPQLAVTAPQTGTGIQPNPTQAYALFGKVEMIVPDACNLQNRKDLIAYMRNLINAGVVTTVVQDISPIY